MVWPHAGTFVSKAASFTSRLLGTCRGSFNEHLCKGEKVPGLSEYVQLNYSGEGRGAGGSAGQVLGAGPPPCKC